MIFFMIAILRPLKQLTSINSQIQSGLIAAKSLFEVIDLPEEKDLGTVELSSVKGKIRFENVSIKFPERDTQTIDNISFNTEPGALVAIVGNSGGGKSTLLNLLMRIYEPTSGTIYLDDIPISEISLKSLRSNISLVSQRVTLFNSSIRDNLTIGQDREISDHEIEDALLKAHALEFVNQLPNGIDSIIGDDNALLSGGQQQRIAIARAILRNSPLLFLDEATSALDSKSELRIKHSLDEIMTNKTTFVVAHRLSTVRNADVILVLENGKILEQGTHQELIDKNGSYARLCELQFGSDE
jgi:subfamily B ATP-binding cassette protein MsbA